MVMNTYSSTSKFLHWTIAILVIGMLFTFFKGYLSKESLSAVFMIHKSVGLIILLLASLRILIILHRGRPPLPASMPRWEYYLSRFIQNSFYILLILMPLSGWIMSVAKNRAPQFFNLFTVPFPGIPQSDSLAAFMAEIHELLAWLLLCFLCVHIAGALKHHYIDKDEILKRMLPGS